MITKQGLWVFDKCITTHVKQYWILPMSEVKKHQPKDTVEVMPSDWLLEIFKIFQKTSGDHTNKHNTNLYLFGDRLHGYTLLMAFGYFDQADIAAMTGIMYLMSRLQVWGQGVWIEHYAPIFGRQLMIGLDYVDSTMVKYIKTHGKRKTTSQVSEESEWS